MILFVTTLPDQLNPKERAQYTSEFVKKQIAELSKEKIEDLVIEKEGWGKPYLKNQNTWHFNLSHSGDQLVLAVSDQAPVGVDIQKHQNFSLGLPAKILCPEELILFKNLDNILDQKDFIFKIWSIKEACLKCIGIGLRYPMNQMLIKKKSVIWLKPEHKLFSRVQKDLEFKVIDLGPNFSTALAIENTTLNSKVLDQLKIVRI